VGRLSDMLTDLTVKSMFYLSNMLCKESVHSFVYVLEFTNICFIFANLLCFARFV